RGRSKLVGEPYAQALSSDGGPHHHSHRLVFKDRRWRESGKRQRRVDSGAPCAHPMAFAASVSRLGGELNGNYGDEENCPSCFLHFLFEPSLVFPLGSMSAGTQVAIKKVDDYVQRVFRFRDICAIEESVKQAFPNMQFRWDAEFHHLLVSVERGAQFEASGSGNDKRRWKFCQNFWRADRRNQGVLGISVGEIAERRTRSRFHRRR